MILHIGIKNGRARGLLEISAEIREKVPGNLGTKLQNNMIALDCGSQINSAEAEAVVKKIPEVAFVQMESPWPPVAYTLPTEKDYKSGKLRDDLSGNYGIF